MRNKYDLDTMSMDDLYNNMKVYEFEIKGQTSSISNSQNVAFVSSDNSSSTNETINTAHSVSATSSKDQASTASYANDVMFSFFANQSNALQLDNEDLEQIDDDDLEEMDLKWLNATTAIGEVILPENVGHQGIREIEIEMIQEGMHHRESDVDDSPVNARFKTGEGFHVVPPPYTENYMPLRPDLSFVRLDDSVYKTKVSETETSISKTSNDIVEKPKTIRPSAPIIEEWDNDSDNV
ncbi:hypothetical protein Tco_1152466 [Tanacetum coccineum]